MSRIDKPWGYEEIIESNDKYTLKKLYMKAQHQCSLQYHNFKHETIYVIRGKLNITLNDKVITLCSGDSCIIPPKSIHRMSAIGNATYLEASTSELDDVVRLEDDYGRK